MSILGPDGAPVAQTPAFDKHLIGGLEVATLRPIGACTRPAINPPLEQAVGMLWERWPRAEMVEHAMLREIAQLRQRVELLEADANAVRGRAGDDILPTVPPTWDTPPALVDDPDDTPPD